MVSTAASTRSSVKIGPAKAFSQLNKRFGFLNYGGKGLKARRLRAEAREIAKERVEILLKRAFNIYRAYPNLADRYVELARRLSMRYKVRIPPAHRLFICRKCKGLMVPGFTARVRLRQRREPHLALTCFKCGGVKRIPLKG